MFVCYFSPDVIAMPNISIGHYTSLPLWPQIHSKSPKTISCSGTAKFVPGKAVMFDIFLSGAPFPPSPVSNLDCEAFWSSLIAAVGAAFTHCRGSGLAWSWKRGAHAKVMRMGLAAGKLAEPRLHSGWGLRMSVCVCVRGSGKLLKGFKSP